MARTSEQTDKYVESLVEHPDASIMASLVVARQWLKLSTLLLSVSFFFLRLIVLFPFSFQRQVGRVLGRLLYRLGGKRRHITTRNIELCFPELDDDARAAMVKQCFDSIGMGFVEICAAWWCADHRLEGLLEIKGLEHLEAALKVDKGVVFLSGHFTCMELLGRLVSREIDFSVMYRRHNHPLLEHLITKSRSRCYDQVIERKDIRSFYRSLRENRIVWFAADQDYGAKRSVFAPFFNIPTAVITTLSRVTETTGSAVVPFNFYRREDGTGYVLELSKPLENFPTGSEEQDATRINQIIETVVRAHPTQYLWQHRRFKTRPEGEGKLY